MTTLQQNTPEWLEMRKTMIGASEWSIIDGSNPWTSSYQLWRRKTGLDPDIVMNDAMRRGNELEPEARDALTEELGDTFFSRVIIHKELPYLLASLDAITLDGKTAVEIKCTGARTHAIATRGEVPAYYIPQLQAQMFISGLEEIYYFSYQNLIDYHLIKVQRDEDYIQSMLPKLAEFYEFLVSGLPPPLTERDYVAIEDPEFEKVAEEWKSVNSRLKELTKLDKELKDKLLTFTDDGNCKGFNVMISRVNRKGNVDVKRLCKENNIDAEKFRTKSIGYWKITETKEEEK